MSIYHIYVEWDIGVSKKQFSVNKKKEKAVLPAVSWHRMTCSSLFFLLGAAAVFSHGKSHLGRHMLPANSSSD